MDIIGKLSLRAGERIKIEELWSEES